MADAYAADLARLDRFYNFREALLRECHEKQRAFLEDTSQYKAALCGRRSGKTEGDAREIALDLERSSRDEWVAYAARTRGLAKDLIWARLVDINQRHQLGWNMREHEGLIQTSRGAAFRIFGFDKIPEIEKLRGYKLRRFIADEPATYDLQLKKLITSSVGPALADLRGGLTINGTPGFVCVGYWYEASTGRLPRYSQHKWTVLDNTKFPRDPRQMLAEEMRENGWTEESEAYRREWMAEWFNDPEQTVYKYVESRNRRAVPRPESDWLITLGIDFGLRNQCAWTVLGSPPHSREIYTLRSFKVSDLIPDDAADVTAELVGRFDPTTIVGDTGGLGAPYAETYNRRFGARTNHYIKAADKLGKLGHIRNLNGDLRKPRLFISETDCDDLIAEIQSLPWANERRDKEHPDYDNHCADSWLYSHTCHTSYFHEPAPPKQDPVDAWESADLERFQSQQRAGWCD